MPRAIFLRLASCFFLIALLNSCGVSAQAPIRAAAETPEKYLHLLKNKRVGIFANHTATVGKEHLVDVLKRNNVNIVAIFAPEHGFRGDMDAGQKFDTAIDPQTGIKIVSLYGKKRRPEAADLKDIDVMVFDIQDVGVRFYTYISSLEEYMLSAIEFDKPLVILDRPNPNGFYVDGPVLEKPFRSFIGMQPIPIVYGMTIGEYGKMLLGEKWLDSSILAKKKKNFSLTVVPCSGYTHQSKYQLPVAPSPNLPDMTSIYLYPSTCLFEGTALNEGRGTDKAFQVFGHPDLPKTMYAYTPVSRYGAANPKLLNQRCYGWNLSGTPESALEKINGRIQLKWLLEAYRLFPDKKEFFLKSSALNPTPTGMFFNKLAGNAELMAQVNNGASEAAIRKSWQPALDKFKSIRKKYLIYP